MTAETLVYRLLEAGLLQAGIFEALPNTRWRWQLDMLPSYPDLLAALADEVARVVGAMPIDRLVCSATALPLGVLVSAHTQLPLVYSRGQGQAPTYDLVGAYDVGHPAALITHTATDSQIERIIQGGQSIGLDIIAVVAIVNDAIQVQPYPLHTLFSDADIETVLKTTLPNVIP